MSVVSLEEISLLENRIALLERVLGQNNSDANTPEVIRSLEEVNTKVDKMLGKHPKTQLVLKRLGELNTYTDPNFIMKYDPAKFIQEAYVSDSYTRIQNACQDLKKIDELKGVVNPPNLKNVPELEKKLGPVTLKCLEIHDEGEVVNSQISELVSKYNDIINTLSEQFVQWDALLRQAEEYYRKDDHPVTY